jgi:hypothetical protein
MAEDKKPKDDKPKDYKKDDDILLNGKKIGKVTQITKKGGSSFVTANLDPAVAERLAKNNDAT